MKKKIDDFTAEEIRGAFGDVGELDEAPADLEMDPESEGEILETLDAIRSDIESVAIEPEQESVPASFQAAIDQARSETFARLAAEEAELDAKAEGFKSDSESQRTRGENEGGWLSTWFRSSLFGPLAGIAVTAALAMGVFVVVNHSGSAGSEVVILAPGPETGFADPVFVWERKDESRPATLEVIDTESGEVVGRTDAATSPVWLSSITEGNLLSPGSNYRVRMLVGDDTLAEKNFATTSHAVPRGPRREPTLEGVIQQCEDFIASDRSADAWMLWTQLTEEEKRDPRMLELKTVILEKIG